MAAANPIHGRYDTRKSLRQNIAMTAPIMSRFDLFFVVLDDCNEATDYNLARHILSIHRLKDAAVEPEFKAEVLQRYIQFARKLKPQFTSEAAMLLVEKYCILRQNDIAIKSSNGSGASAYRMTVRQLESMIRLSEALARVHLDKDIHPKYVREAYRLLKSSIIRVESESVELSTEALVSDRVPDVDPNLLHGSIVADGNGLPATAAVPTGATLSMKYEDYVRISNLLVYQIRHSSTSSSEDDMVGMKRSQLIEWYLLQMENEMESEADFELFKRRCRAVIDRLVHKDCVLIELKDSSSPNDPLLVVHPNYQP